MIGWLLRPGRVLVKVLTDADSSRQIALGFAWGMIVGLVPKGNLIARMLGIVLFASRANLGSGAPRPRGSHDTNIVRLAGGVGRAAGSPAAAASGWAARLTGITHRAMLAKHDTELSGPGHRGRVPG